MPSIVRDIGVFVTATSSGGSATTALGHLDDAAAITIFVTSSASTSSTGASIQISVFDPADAVFSTSFVSQSTLFYNYGLTSTTAGLVVLTSGAAQTISNVGFRGIRLSGLTSAIASETVAWVTKQINV